MQIELKDHLAGARAARGLTVIIDVFRACSTLACAVAFGATRVLPVAGVRQARELSARLPGALLAGERHARRLPGFDAGNSPTELAAIDLRGRTLVHTTHAGTRGLACSRAAPEVLAGAFVNISAVAAYIAARRPPRVTLVRMGHEARERCVEDDLYARCLIDLLEGRDPGLQHVRALLRAAPAARKFFDPAFRDAPQRDFDVCTDVDRYDFVLRLKRTPGAPCELERLDPPWPVAEGG
jgi:2-phosphosulfolactate phosphatase